MTEFWKACEGQVVDNKFRLQQYLAATEHSAVFLTEVEEPQPQKAAIKFISPDPSTADHQLSLWKRAAQLSHPNLLSIFHTGRCRLENRDLLYVVMEYAEEDLAQILPQRSLSTTETRDVLEPILDVLVYLHAKGFAHSHIKPSNILATSDRVKLSSDTVSPAGESHKVRRESDIYDAPEAASSPLSTSGDIWSLGVTLVEALTQQAPHSPLDNQSNPIFPDTLPQPFLDIACHALRRDPKRRWTTADIAGRLNPAMVAAAAAGQAVSPVAVPLPSAPAISAAKPQKPRSDVLPPRPQAPRQQPAGAAKQTLVLPNYVVPALAVILIIVAIFALPKILGRRPESPSSTSAASGQPASQPKPESQPARREASASGKSSPQNSLKGSAAKRAAEPVRPAAATPAPASLRTETFPSANASKTAASSPLRGEVLDQVLPEVSEKARTTIHGTVRVAVRVHVDPVGNVSQAELDSPGPSKYFAEQALKAARRWQFASPEVNGHSAPSEWVIRFQFSQSGTKVFPTQTSP